MTPTSLLRTVLLALTWLLAFATHAQSSNLGFTQLAQGDGGNTSVFYPTTATAGGHTALSLAGGAWSPARFRDHCERNIEVDFSSCVGFTTRLEGNWLDGIKVWIAQRVISWRFSDDALQRYVDPRVKASVAMVPFAADFAPQSLVTPRVALGLVIAAKDVNQMPTLHAEAIRRVCEPRCEVIMYLADAGHGAMLSPMPPLQQGSVAAYLLGDPPEFDRAATLPILHSGIAEFFNKNLLSH